MPPGLPSLISTACRKDHLLDVPAATMAWNKYPPPGVVNSTQQSSMAVRRMATLWA